MRREHGLDRTIWLLLCAAAAAHGLLYVFVVPAWQHHDEPTHFEYAWLIANRLTLPKWGDYDQPMRREVAASMWEHGFFRDLNFEPNLLVQGEPIWIGISELRHPPVYYLLLALPLRLVRYADVATQLTVARMVSFLLHLFTIWIAYHLVGELVPAGHPLRWAVPGMMALLPGYVNIMTAVNNDVGAITLVSLFLWGGVRMIMRGVTPARLAWVMGVSALCAYTKSTALVTAAFIPVILVLSWPRRLWRWQAVLILLVGALAVVLGLFSWGDAASWQRNMLQKAPTSQSVLQAPWGKRALTLEGPTDQSWQPLVQLLPMSDVEALKGKTITVGAWMWASQPTQAYVPIPYDGQGGRQEAVSIDSVPAFHAITTTISPTADQVMVILRRWVDPASGDAIAFYYDGIVLLEGEWPQDIPPFFEDDDCRKGVWQGTPFVNRLRNGSAEATWPFVRPWADGLAQRYLHFAPSAVLASVSDWQRTGWVHQVVATALFESFWARFGWGQVRLGQRWYWGLGVATGMGIAGAIVAVVRVLRSRGLSCLKRAMALLALASLVVWGIAFMRPHPITGQPFVPVARYIYPAIIPSALALVGGWWTPIPGRLRRWVLWVVFAAMVVIDIVSLLTLQMFLRR